MSENHTAQQLAELTEEIRTQKSYILELEDALRRCQADRLAAVAGNNRWPSTPPPNPLERSAQSTAKGSP